VSILIASALLLNVASTSLAHDLQPPKPEEHESLTEIQKAEAYGDETKAHPQASAINPQPRGFMREAAAQQEHQRSDHIRPEATVAEWIMVGITAAYVIVALFTLRAIKHQADLSEQAMTSLERPWIDVKLVSLNGGPIGNQPTITVVGFRFINYGKSPARIIRSWLHFRKVIPSSLPPEPIYGEMPEGPMVNLAPAKMTPVIQVGANLTAEEALAIAVDPKQLTVMLFGYVDYTDVFGKDHQTRFCYFYYPPSSIILPVMPIPGSLQMGGPPSYNRQT